MSLDGSYSYFIILSYLFSFSHNWWCVKLLLWLWPIITGSFGMYGLIFHVPSLQLWEFRTRSWITYNFPAAVNISKSVDVILYGLSFNGKLFIHVVDSLLYKSYSYVFLSFQIEVLKKKLEKRRIKISKVTERCEVYLF